MDKITDDIEWIRKRCPELFKDTFFNWFLNNNFSKFIK